MKQDKHLEILDRVLKLARGEATATLTSSTSALTRFGENMITQNVSSSRRTLTLTVWRDKKPGSASVNDFSDEAIGGLVKRANEIAANVPVDPEYVGPAAPQKLDSIPASVEATAKFGPAERAAMVRMAIDVAKKEGLSASGTCSSGEGSTAIRNSAGVSAAHAWTTSGFSTTMRTPDGTGSSRAEAGSMRDVGRIEPETLAKRAAERAKRSKGAKEIPPGDYTVVMEPQAVADLISTLGWQLSAREADEGRSFFTGKLGQSVCAPAVTLRSVPAHPDLLGSPFDGEGMAAREIAWINKGVVDNLHYTRYWAAKQGKPPTTSPGNLVLDGDASKTVADLIRGTKRGLLLTRFWYIRMVDPKQILVTGLTRDGTFEIEDGEVRGPVTNYRWNESPIAVLSNVEDFSRAEKVGEMVVPGLRVKAFTLTSPSKAV